MYRMWYIFWLLTCLSLAVSNFRSFDHLLQKRALIARGSALTVDLGYGVYKGVFNTTLNLNIWKGIRYAEPPLGKLRWQAPQTPSVNRSAVVPAEEFGASCPQSFANFQFGPTNGSFGSEDCLFLNVWAPLNARKLPVLAWIHGGGYGEGSDQDYDLGRMTAMNEGDFVAVSFQYRLGAFGFLASDEVSRYGVLNAGLLDQQFALQWVQTYIGQFGGDPSKVTIFGESAGAGSVMLHDLSYGGTLGTALFRNSIAASVWLPKQYSYDDSEPKQAYMAFANHAGCLTSTPALNNASDITFQCLVSKSTEDLQKAAFVVSSSAFTGFWAFSPVTDGSFITERPSSQLLKKKVNGERALVGNNAEEGPLFTPQNITTEDDLVLWLRSLFPLFSAKNISQILQHYPGTNASVDPDALEFSTLGDAGPTALVESELATGQQERADLILGEAIIVCPSYWLAEAYADKKVSYKYQYSVPVATHGADISAYFGPPGLPDLPTTFQRAFMTIIGNFVTKNNPSIAPEIANAGFNGTSSSPNPASNWPPFRTRSPYQLNLNQTEGVPFSTGGSLALGAPHNVTEYENPGLRNNFTLANAYTWEGGRGPRCDFWRSLGDLIPA